MGIVPTLDFFFRLASIAATGTFITRSIGSNAILLSFGFHEIFWTFRFATTISSRGTFSISLISVALDPPLRLVVA